MRGASISMWKAPQRPHKKVSQTYNDGLCRVFSESDESQPGYQPQIALSEKIRLPYENRKLGIQRFYSGRQNQTEISRVIRVPHAGNVSNLDTVITEDGARYRIDLVQPVPDVYPASDDLTLVKYEQGVTE